MADPILTTKLHIPIQGTAKVKRQQLENQINQSLSKKLTLISAPAGFGKTTLISNWIHQSGFPASWVSLDESDNDISSFVSYIITALQNINPNIGKAILPLLKKPQPVLVQTIVHHLLNDMALCDGSVLFLVLDDYHVIKNPEIHLIMQKVLAKLPSNCHVIILTRSDPPFSLALMRGRQELLEIRTADFRFSFDEANEFLIKLNQLTLTKEAVNLLTEKTEGWITGLHLAVLSLQNRSDSEQFIKSFKGSNRFILDYLFEEVLEQISPNIVLFLLKTSILSELTADLCEKVSGCEDSQKILEQLERDNIFIVSLDDHRKWFRYHHLFRDLLLQQIAKHPDQVSDLRGIASKWYEDEGKLGLAIDYAIEGSFFVSAIEMLDRYTETMWEHGDQIRFSKWLRRIPPDLLISFPKLISYHAFSLCFSGQFERAEEQLLLIESKYNIDDHALESMINLVRAFSALYQDDIEKARNLAENALELLPENYHTWKTLGLAIYGDACAFEGNVKKCYEVWERAYNESFLTRNLFFSLWISAKLVFTQKRKGLLHKADKTFNEQIQILEERNCDHIAAAGAIFSVYGNILIEWNQVNEAMGYIKDALSLCERQNYLAGIAWSAISLVEACYIQNGINGLGKALIEYEEKISKYQLPAWSMSWYCAWKARYFIESGNFEKAESVFSAFSIHPDGNIRYPFEVSFLVYARLLIVKGKFLKAEKLVNRLLKHSESSGWVEIHIEAGILKALLFWKQGKKQEAMDCMAPILESTEEEGYLVSYLREGEDMEKLLLSFCKIRPSDYINKILPHFHRHENNEYVKTSEKILVEPLSDRESEVLVLLANGDSNKEISGKLFIAIGTVKNHLKNIYSKLDVNNRTQAVARARVLSIIE